MDTNRFKKAAEWFYNTVFKDEAIRPRSAPNPEHSPERRPVQRPAEPKADRIPPLLRTARSLESGMPDNWQSREAVFIKQARLLALYEDDCPCETNVVRYYPTYQSLTDRELRGYFTWRTRLRRGEVCKTSLSYAFLYIYELLNQIGVPDAMDGYQKLRDFRDTYGRLDAGILPYLNRWLTDYVIYYELDAGLLADSPQVLLDRSITVLDNIQNQSREKIIYAVKTLAPKWLERSRFYSAYMDDCDAVIVRVLRRVWNHYATRCKKTMVEQYFGTLAQQQIKLFDAAVFYDQKKKRHFEYVVDERCVYRCQSGLWTVQKHRSSLSRSNPQLDALLKTIDSVMRQEYGYRHPVKCETDVKWLLKIIQEEVRALLAEKEAAEAAQKAADANKITIDYSQLDKIRRDAAETRDKLAIGEEELPLPEEQIPIPTFLPEPEADPVPNHTPEASVQTESPLRPAEYRLLQCLLYGGDLGWVQAEGHLLSVLVDSINEKLYDAFMDSVLDDTPELIEDYIEDLKEMVCP